MEVGTGNQERAVGHGFIYTRDVWNKGTSKMQGGNVSGQEQWGGGKGSGKSTVTQEQCDNGTEEREIGKNRKWGNSTRAREVRTTESRKYVASMLRRSFLQV